MHNSKEVVAGTIGTFLSAVGTSMQTEEVLQTISLIITIIGAIITYIVIPIINHIRHSKSDGKITIDEVVDGADIIADGIDKITDEVKKEDGKDA